MERFDLIKETDKIFVKKQEYTMYSKDYLYLYKELEYGKYKNIRNYYKEAKELGWLDKNNFNTFAVELNQVLWKFLLANKKSRNDIENLNKVIDIFNKTSNTLQKIDDSKNVLEYLSESKYKSYVNFSQYFGSKYGIDIEEYMRAKNNGFNLNKDLSDDNWSSEYQSIYDSTQTLDMLIPILQKNKEKFLTSEDDGFSIFEDEITKSTIYPVYKQNYNLPILEVVKFNKVVLEFNILDDKKDIKKLIDEVYKKEKEYKKSLYSSTKLNLLESFKAGKKLEKFNSIPILKKASILYQYMHDKDEKLSLEDARSIYNFHVFLYACNNTIDSACKKNMSGDQEFIVCKNEDIITENLKKKEIRKQIKIIKSLLNLTDPEVSIPE